MPRSRKPAFRCLGLALSLAAGVALAQTVPPGTVADIRERTTPFGSVCVEGEDCGGQVAAPTATVALSGSDVYGKFCHTCHGTGLNDAPKLGDADAWSPRLA